MSGYSLYNRHEHMSAETLGDIMDIIRDVRFEDGTFELTNMLYGLFDGYLYDNLIVEADNTDMSKETFRKILKVWAVVSKYPKYQYVAGSNESNDAEAIEYSEGMGVADGKLYLASL